MSHISWQGLDRNYTKLPPYDERCLLTIYSPSKNKEEVVIGARISTDAQGEHWSYGRVELQNADDVEVIAWEEMPEPYNPH